MFTGIPVRKIAELRRLPDVKTTDSEEVMLIFSLALTAEAAAPTIVNVSAFKNGYAFVTREVKVDASGDAEVPILQGALGTIWFNPDAGMKVEWVKTFAKDSSYKLEFVDNPSVLAANVGKSIQLTLKDDDILGNLVSGKLERVVQNSAVFRIGTTQHLIGFDRIVAVGCLDGEFTLDKQLKTTYQSYRIHTTGGTGKVRYTALQPGFGWAPSYSITLEDDSHLQLKARTTMFNSLEAIKGGSIRMVTGFANTAFAAYSDSMTMDYGSYINMISQLDIDNPLANFNGAMMNNFAFRGGGFGGGGGFNRGTIAAGTLPSTLAGSGAGGGRAGEGAGKGALGGQGFDAVTADPLLADRDDKSQPEDQYTFVQNNVDIEANGRSSYELFSAKCSYERLYRCNLTDADVQHDGSVAKTPDIWQILQFKNESGKPLTTAIGSIFEQDTFLAQAAIKYTAAGAKGEIKLSKALSLPLEVNEGETGRDRGAIKSRPADRKQQPLDLFDAVTITGTINVTNTKDRPITFVITRDVVGDMRDRDGGVYTPSTKNLSGINKIGRIEWKKKIEPGKSEAIKYSYRTMVPTPKE